MSTNRDPRRSIAAWLEGEAPDRAPGRLIDASRERIRSIRQRRAWWPAWRATDMNSFAKWAIAAAAVIVVAIVGYNLLPSPAGTAIQAAGASPSIAAATSAVPSANPSPAVGAVCTLTPVKFDPTARIDLTGAWAGNDGGIYYVRQRGNVIWWNGMSSRNDPPESLGRNWNNVGRGEINADLTIVADWADVPRGLIDGYGTVTFKVGADGAGDVQITKMSETGTGRDDTTWSRCEPGFPG
jgi:hypothetical protein